MKQSEIIELLREAATATPGRRNEIIVLFQDALPEDTDGKNGRPDRNDLHRDTMSTLLAALFFKTPKERLVSLAPFVTLMCGERDPNIWTADIDWANIPQG